MGDLVSPGVQVKEKDLTSTVASEPTSVGAMAGIFTKGPVSEVVTLFSEEELVDIFGTPNGTNYEYWFTAASFLLYSNTLRVVRMETGSGATALLNSCVSGSALRKR